MKTFLRRLKWMLQRRKRQAELRDELAFHLAEEADERKAAGLAEDDARFAAQRDFGSVALVAEDTRNAWGLIWVERVGQDVRYALRILRRRPGFAATAILTLTLGIGANTAVFSILNSLLMRTLPVDRSEELVRLIEAGRDARDDFTLVTHTTLQSHTRTLSGVLASSTLGVRPNEIEEGGERLPVFLQFVSDNYFDVLGVRAFRGRVFHPVPGSPGEAIAVISHEYWRRHYASDPSALGARFRVRSGHEFTIAGITPPHFRGTEIDVPTDIWVSVERVVPPGDTDRVRGRWMRVMGRLQPGATVQDAEAESGAILGRAVRWQSGATGYSTLRRRLLQPLLLLALVFALVLLITCANLANLMLAATVSRERELGVRTAVGASRSRIVRQLVTENLVLGGVGGVMAVGAAHWISAFLLGFLPPDQAVALPNLQFELDSRVLMFAAVLSCATCLGFGLLPALRATGKQSGATVRAGAGTGQQNRGWLRRGLLVSQVVMCTAVLVIAVVFLRSLQNLRGQDAGYFEDRLVVAEVQPPSEYPEDRRDRMIEELRTGAAALPGVEVAAFSHVGQLSGSALEYRIGFPGQTFTEGSGAEAIEQRVSPGFLRAMGTQFIAGRDVAATDDERSPLVAVVNESFARRFLTGRNPIGARFFREAGSRSGELMEVVGVARDSKWSNLRDDPPAMSLPPVQADGRYSSRTTRHSNIGRRQCAGRRPGSAGSGDRSTYGRQKRRAVPGRRQSHARHRAARGRGVGGVRCCCPPHCRSWPLWRPGVQRRATPS